MFKRWKMNNHLVMQDVVRVYELGKTVRKMGERWEKGLIILKGDNSYWDNTQRVQSWSLELCILLCLLYTFVERQILSINFYKCWNTQEVLKYVYCVTEEFFSILQSSVPYWKVLYLSNNICFIVKSFASSLKRSVALWTWRLEIHVDVIVTVAETAFGLCLSVIWLHKILNWKVYIT